MRKKNIIYQHKNQEYVFTIDMGDSKSSILSIYYSIRDFMINNEFNRDKLENVLKEMHFINSIVDCAKWYRDE